MNAYRKDYGGRLGTNMERVKLDMYLTYAPCGACPPAMNCARQLIEFAEEYNFKLNIKAAAPYINNRVELCELMASDNCTVKAFTEEDYRNLAWYLGFPLFENWERPQATTARDEQIRQMLNEIQD